MENVIISDENVAAEMGRNLSDNLFFQDSFTFPAFVRFCKSLPSFYQVQYHIDDFDKREKPVIQSVCIHFFERPRITIDLCSNWFLDVFLKERGFNCEFTSSYKLFKKLQL